MKIFCFLSTLLAWFSFSCNAFGGEIQFRIQEFETRLNVGYAVSLDDVNGDGKQDIVVVDTDRVVWYENPSWRKRVLIQGQTSTDNVCLAPYDIDGDGKLDYALGADWKPFNTRSGGTIQWLSRPGGSGPADAEAKWAVHPIGEEPTVHRMRWADVDGDGKKELIVVPLMGKNTQAPNWSENTIRVLAFGIPKDPRKDPWPMQVLNDELHVAHNFQPTDMDGDGQTEIIIASFEGVSVLKRNAEGKWPATRIGEGNQKTSPNRGASEIKRGFFSGKEDYIATIEPWHGHQVVVYTPPADKGKRFSSLWERKVLDEELKWGHAVWCADLDGDAEEELIIGIRDDMDDKHKCGLRIYDPSGSKGKEWKRQLVDAGGVAIEDLALADLNGDGRQDIVAVGRKSKNGRIYWNEGVK